LPYPPPEEQPAQTEQNQARRLGNGGEGDDLAQPGTAAGKVKFQARGVHRRVELDRDVLAVVRAHLDVANHHASAVLDVEVEPVLAPPSPSDRRVEFGDVAKVRDEGGFGRADPAARARTVVAVE